jgi:predicted metalloprotease
MRWKGRRESDNIEDRRGVSGGLIAGGGIVTVLIALAVALMGGDPSKLLGGSTGTEQSRPLTEAEKERGKFVAVVLADTEDVWTDLFQKMGKTYRLPTLVMFSGQVNSACGFANAAVGPFYCPEDYKVYIDLAFYDELKNRFGAPGEFAQAYVVAHEVGHHVQNLLGVMDEVNKARKQLSPTEFNKLSVRMELQADFLAGVWAHHAQKLKNILNERDIADALRAATAIGDDNLQLQSQGRVVPDAFTHGTSEQRVRWFRKGWETGDLKQGDTFGAKRL